MRNLDYKKQLIGIDIHPFLERWRAMTVVEALKSAQYVIDQNGRRTAVLLTMQSWQSLLDWIEDLADAQAAAETLTALQASGGHPEQAGWLAWDDISEEWGDGDETALAPTSL